MGSMLSCRFVHSLSSHGTTSKTAVWGAADELSDFLCSRPNKLGAAAPKVSPSWLSSKYFCIARPISSALALQSSIKSSHSSKYARFGVNNGAPKRSLIFNLRSFDKKERHVSLMSKEKNVLDFSRQAKKICLDREGVDGGRKTGGVHQH